MRPRAVLDILLIICVIACIFIFGWYAKNGFSWAKYAMAAIGVMFVILTVRGIILHRLYWSTGTEIARFNTHPQENELICEGSFVVRDADYKSKWCRIACDISAVSQFSEHRWRWPAGFEYPTNDYSFELFDASGHVLYAESGSLRKFLSFLWSRGSSRPSAAWSTQMSELDGHFALFEFVAPGPGEYKLRFHIVADDERTSEAFLNRTEILGLQLFVKQGVYPMKQRAYPHNRVLIERDKVVSQV